jgi:hypothetical protein
MNIAQIWMSQKKLRRIGQIKGMIAALQNGGDLPKIELVHCEDEIQVHDGHHRLVAIWLSGRRTLHRHEYILLEQDQYQGRFGKIEELVRKVGDCGK